jgi:hypothetical protein
MDSPGILGDPAYDRLRNRSRSRKVDFPMRRLAKSARALTSPKIKFAQVLFGEEQAGKVSNVLRTIHNS